MIPEVTAGGAPWMAIAEQAEAEGVKEGTHNAVISKYFAAHEFWWQSQHQPAPGMVWRVRGALHEEVRQPGRSGECSEWSRGGDQLEKMGSRVSIAVGH